MLIETALTIGMVFHLPLRQTEGFFGSLFALLGSSAPVPDHTAISRRAAKLGKVSFVAMFEIGFIPTRAFESKSSRGNLATQIRLPTFRAFAWGRIIHTLQFFYFVTTRLATIFINWHVFRPVFYLAHRILLAEPGNYK